MRIKIIIFIYLKINISYLKKKNHFKLLSMKFSILVYPTTICIIIIKNESMIVFYLRFINFNIIIFFFLKSFNVWRLLIMITLYYQTRYRSIFGIGED